MAKIFVLDTNIILHDHTAIKQFQDNDIVIPIAVVEELDKFKKGNDALSFNARSFMREMNKLMDRKPNSTRGYPLEPNHPFAPKYQDLFRDDTQDHRILSTAMWVRDHNPNRFVALVTKDINLRLKAKAVGMEAQDYLRDRVDDEVMMSLEQEVITVEASSEATQRLAYGQDNTWTGGKSSPTHPCPTSCTSSSSEARPFVADTTPRAMSSPWCARNRPPASVPAMTSRSLRWTPASTPRFRWCPLPAAPARVRRSSPWPPPWSRLQTTTRLSSPVPPWCWAARI